MVDGRTTDMAGEENDNRGGCDQSIAVEIPCNRQSNGDPVRTREDTLLGRLRMAVEAGVRLCKVVINTKQKIADTLEL